MAERAVLLYDGTCGFCTWVAEVGIALLPGRVRWEPYQSADLAAYGLSTAEAAASVRLAEPSGRLSHGATAVSRSLVLSGAPWSVAGRLLLAPPVALVAEAVYRLVSSVRHRLPGSSPALVRLPQDRPGAGEPDASG